MGCVIFVVVLALILLGGYTAYRLILKARVRAELEWFAEAGYPTTLEELDAWYPTPPPGENAADIYMEAFQNLAEAAEADLPFLPMVGEADLPPTGEPLPEEMKQAIARYLDANREALRLLHQAAAYEQCRYPIDLTAGFEAILPHVDSMRAGTRLLALEAITHAEQDNAPGAAQSIRSALALAESPRSEPTLISQLLHWACYEIAVETLEFALATTSFTDQQLSEMSSALAEADSWWPDRRAWVGEAILVSDAFNMSLEELANVGLWYTRSGGQARWVLYVGSGARELDHLALLRLWRQLLESFDLPYRERIQTVRDLEAQLERLPFYCIVTLMTMPAFGAAAESEGSTRAEMRAAQVALAVERCRLAHGDLPARLEDLVPDYLDGVPLDPFDGAPLRYKRTEKGYVVYSIGPDGVDDGGQKAPEGTPRDDPDVVFAVER